MRGVRPQLKEIEGGLLKSPAPPETLPAASHGDWQIVTADLQGRGLLFSSSLGIVEAYCTALWTARECRKVIADQGLMVQAKGMQLKPNPANSMLKSALEAIARLGAELGLTPSSRMRRGMNTPEDPGDDDAALLGI